MLTNMAVAARARKPWSGTRAEMSKFYLNKPVQLEPARLWSFDRPCSTQIWKRSEEHRTRRKRRYFGAFDPEQA
jgi:hypothetical protein